MRTVSDLFARAALVVATLMLFTFACVAASQACPSVTSSTAPAGKNSQSAPQVAKQYTVLKRAAVASSVVKRAIKSTACCANGAGHCHGFAYAGPCCPACSAGLIVAGWRITRDVALHVGVPSLLTRLPAIESDTQFRPPRIVL